jgi:DNA-binding NtrC family response regulator
MLTSSTLLVSHDPQLTRTIQQAHDNCDLLHLEICGRIEKAQTRLRINDVVLVLVHLTPETSPDHLRRFLREASVCARATVVLICNDESAATAGRYLLQEGAADLLCLPEDSGKLVRLMNDAVRRTTQPSGDKSSDPELSRDQTTTLGFVEAEYLTQIRRVAAQDTTILLTGETGTGKTMLARHIHEASPRKKKPFTVVDCSALAASLIESEMFGHVRGAFTGADKDRTGKFAAAADGTLVLDEINSLPLALQSKLLRAVEERVFEPLGSNRIQPLQARIIAIANVPLEREVAKERFRADLYYRLNVVGFQLPPLRMRTPEILPLARRFLSENAQAQAQGIIGISPEALLALETYDWPGNVRELRNVIERVGALCTGKIVSLGDLPDALRRQPPAPRAVAPISMPTTPTDHVGDSEETEVWRICEALKKHRNNRVRAASELGMSRVSLYKKLHKYGLFEKNTING